MMVYISILAASLMLVCVSTTSFSPPLEGVENRTSTFDNNISVSSKETSAICETTPNVKSYSGYVSMSPAALEFINGKPGFSVNTFYWFFESRNDPTNAPFVLWLGGGPGFSGIASALFENGPCIVNKDSNSTLLNPFSWNNEANILYIDSPAMAGYSYDRLVNATIDGLNPMLDIIPSEETNLPEGNNTFHVGTFGSQDDTQVSNSTGNVVPAIWTAMQAWFAHFPQYQPANNIMSIWTESYGGRYGPLTAEYFGAQNDAIKTGQIRNAVPLHIDTLGIINGYTDPILQAESYPAFVNNNTYGLQTVPEEVQASMQHNLTKAGGCLDALRHCQVLTEANDPQNAATNATSNAVCTQAFLICAMSVQRAYTAFSNRSQDDIAHPQADPFPGAYYAGFLNQAWVQRALGARVNFTINSGTVLDAFIGTGDPARSGALAALGRLLDAGTHVVLMAGDRDYQVNWRGVETVSLAVDYNEAASFRGAGYADLVAPNGSAAGFVRQAGHFAFARIFQAGHNVPAYQPEVALTIVARALAHRDIATGEVDLREEVPFRDQDEQQQEFSFSKKYKTTGHASVFHVKNTVPESPSPVCYTWAIPFTCTELQQQALADGTGVVKDFILQTDANGVPVSKLTSCHNTSALSGLFAHVNVKLLGAVSLLLLATLKVMRRARSSSWLRSQSFPMASLTQDVDMKDDEA